MAAAWRPPHDPLRQYLAAAAAEDGAIDPGDDGDEAEAEPEPPCVAEDEESLPPAPADAAATTQWWARWRGRLTRHGILLLVPPAPGPPTHHKPASPSINHDERLLRAVLRYQLTARAALRQLQGALALLCGRGVAVPIPPLAALGGLAAAAAVAEDAEAEAEAHCPALPALRVALVGSLARAAAGLASAAAATEDHHDPVLASLLALGHDAGRGTHSTGLLQVQAAMQAWAAVAGGVLGGAEGGWGDVEAAVAGLEAERAFVAEAFRLPEATVVSDGCDGDVADVQEPPTDEQQERSHGHGGITRVRRQLQAMGRSAALGRVRAESLLARLFLRQCAVAEALRRLGGDDDDDDPAGGLEGVVGGLLEEDEGEEDPVLASLLRAVGVDVRGEAATLREAAGLVDCGDWAVGFDDGGGGGWAGPEVLLVAGGGQEEAESSSAEHELPSASAAAAVWCNGGDGPGARQSKSPTTSVEEEEEEDEEVVEVFEGTAAEGGSPGRRRRLPGGRQEQQERQQGALLLGELGRVLEGRARRRQERGQGVVMKVNGQRVTMAECPAPALDPEPIPKPRQRQAAAVAVPTVQGAAALAVSLRDALRAQRREEEEEVFGAE